MESQDRAYERLLEADPVWVDVRRAGDAVPGMTSSMILTSGPPASFPSLAAGQQQAIVGGALFEGLAGTPAGAREAIDAGDITVEPSHHHGTVGSMAGVCTASMPVLVVENAVHGTTGHALLYEGPHRERLTYGVFNQFVRDTLTEIRDVIGPVLARVVRQAGGVRLKPLMREALRMGDDLHSRSNAATLLLLRALAQTVSEILAGEPELVRQRLWSYLNGSELFFLHVAMAGSKASADAAHGVHGSGLVTAMAQSSTEFGVRVSGLGERWFTSALPPVQGKYFEGFGPDDGAHLGGESMINETVGLGGCAAPAAFALAPYLGGADAMLERQERLYSIAFAEHSDFVIPFTGRGTPTGFDVRSISEQRVTPVIHTGIAHRDGGQIGAGYFEAPISVFDEAASALAMGSAGKYSGSKEDRK